MNWFEILKNVGIKQTQRQGISARQKDEDFVFEDEDEGDCYDEFVRMTERVMASFPNGSTLQQYTAERSEHAEFAYDDFYIRADYNLEEKGKIPDEIYCAAIELFKSLPKFTDGRHSAERKVIGDYYIGAQKRKNFYVLTISSTMSSVRDGRIDREVLSLMQVSLIEMNYEDEDKGKSLHKEFDNWRGFF